MFSKTAKIDSKVTMKENFARFLTVMVIKMIAIS